MERKTYVIQESESGHTFLNGPYNTDEVAALVEAKKSNVIATTTDENATVVCPECGRVEQSKKPEKKE